MKPPRGAVRIRHEPVDPTHGPIRHTAACSNCGWTYSNLVRSDVEQHKRWHQCPDGER